MTENLDDRYIWYQQSSFLILMKNERNSFVGYREIDQKS